MSISKSEFVQQCLVFLSELNIACVLGEKFTSDQKGLLASILLDLSNEHCLAASRLLVESKHSSALALLRPALESMLKGVWVYHCISDKDKIRKLSNSDKKSDWKSISSIINEISDSTGIRGFDRYKNDVIGLLSSFTHGSRYPIGLRFHDGSIGFKMSDEQMCIIFNELCFISFHANFGLCALSGKLDKARDLNVQLNNLSEKFEGLGISNDNETKTYEIDFLK